VLGTPKWFATAGQINTAARIIRTAAAMRSRQELCTPMRTCVPELRDHRDVDAGGGRRL
jgi:hypothetical protein